jgi:SAM-dependent methyltransferase
MNYIMENDEEIRRLETKTTTSDVEAVARRAGLKEGMRVMDVGCGPGITTSILAGLVGESGTAVGIDGSAARIARAEERFGGARTSFAVRDFLAPMGDLGPCDFAWVRFVLEYYKAEGRAIADNVSSALADGGVLCLVDLDYNCLSHFDMPARLEGALASAVRQLEAKGDFDPYAGRKLYSHLYRMGYRDIGVEVAAHHLIYGELRAEDDYNWGRKIQVLAARFADIGLPGYSGPEEFYEDFMAFFRDPARFTYTPVIAAWGRKPPAAR